MKAPSLLPSAALGFLAAGFFSASVARASDGTVALEGDTSVSAINALDCSAVVLEDGASITNDADLASAVSVACDGAVRLVADTSAGVSPDGGETAEHDISLFDFSLVSGGVYHDYWVKALRTDVCGFHYTRGAGAAGAGVEVDLTGGGSLALTGGTYHYGADTGINGADTEEVQVTAGAGAVIEVASASGEDAEDRRFNVGNAIYTLTDDARIGTARLLAVFGASDPEFSCYSGIALSGDAVLAVSGRGVDVGTGVDAGACDDAGADIVFGYAANGSADYEQYDAATFTAEDSEILIGWGGIGEYHLSLYGGTMKVRGIKVSGNAEANDEDAIDLLLCGGTLLLGSSGIGAYGETGIGVTVDGSAVVGGFAGEVPVTQPVEVLVGGSLAFTNALGSAGTGGTVTFGITGGWSCAGSVSVGGDVVLDLSGAEVGDAGSFVLSAAGAELVLASGVEASVESGAEGGVVVSEELSGGAVRYALAEAGSGKPGLVVRVL